MTNHPIKKYSLEDYDSILKDIKSLLLRAKSQAYKTIDNLRVQTYWQVGERIAREELKYKSRADYGKKLIGKLSADIGFDERLMYRMLQFYKLYPILSQVATELSWSHYIELLSVELSEERKTYEILCINNGWGRDELRLQIKNKAAKKYQKNQIVKLSQNATQLMPDDIFKNSYNFDFLELKKGYKENDLKKALLEKFEEFIREMGPDFFVGRREAPALVNGNYDKVDLELFHTGLMCYVLVEIKTEPFKHMHVSQMYSYLNWYKENKWKNGQRMPIGLIICRSKDDETVHYALGELKKEIFISEYKTKLPSEREIIKRLK
jgi:predicted nuclease of restriction endonuclease-like (RecB) superfamily